MDLVRLWHVLCRQVHSLKASLANYAVPCLARPKINKVYVKLFYNGYGFSQILSTSTFTENLFSRSVCPMFNKT